MEEECEKIMSDRDLFNKTIYTPLSEALRLLDERRKDKKLMAKIEELLNGDIPEVLKGGGMYGVQSRQLATPNYDTRCFLDLTLNHKLTPVFLEYLDDKLTSNNSFKYSLGILRVYEKSNKKGEDISEKINIVDFSKDDGKNIKDILTIHNESLIDFHHRIFNAWNLKKDQYSFFDTSGWFERHGKHANKYYYDFLLLFICHGIFFENFLFLGDEGEFTKKIFLPALLKINKLLNIKPIIVPIPPIDNENDFFWFSYSKKIKPYIKL